MTRILNSADWHIFKKEPNMISLKDIYYSNVTDIVGENDKGTVHSYIDIYEELFKDKREQAKLFVEIGVAQGYSMLMWRKYFPESCRVLGIDLNKCPLISDSIDIEYGDSTNSSLWSHIDNIDLLVDDGDHSPEGQLATARTWLPKIKNSGIYIIEDVYSFNLINIQNILIDYKLQQSIVEVYDLRPNKNRYDDILIVIKVIK